MKRTMTYNELANMHNSLLELPLYVTRKVGNEYKVYVYSHSSTANGYIRKYALYNPQPYKGRFGVGFTVKSNNSSSSRYCYKTYYIEVKNSIICAANDNCTLCPLYSRRGPVEECHHMTSI